MTISQERTDLLLDQFLELSDDDFEQWLLAQSDAVELSKELLTLINNPSSQT